MTSNEPTPEHRRVAAAAVQAWFDKRPMPYETDLERMAARAVLGGLLAQMRMRREQHARSHMVHMTMLHG